MWGWCAGRTSRGGAQCHAQRPRASLELAPRPALRAPHACPPTPARSLRPRPPALGLPTTRSRTGSRSRIPLRPRGLRRPAVWVGKAPLRLEVSLCGPLLPPRGPSPLRDSQPLGGRVSTRPDWTRGARAPSRAFCRAGRDASPGLREVGEGSGSVPPTVAGVTRLRCPAGAGRPFRPL